VNKEEAPSFRIIHRSDRRDLLPADLPKEVHPQEVLLGEAIRKEVIPTETARILLRRRAAIRKER